MQKSGFYRTYYKAEVQEYKKIKSSKENMDEMFEMMDGDLDDVIDKQMVVEELELNLTNKRETYKKKEVKIKTRDVPRVVDKYTKPEKPLNKEKEER